MSATGKLKGWLRDQKDTSVSFVLQKLVQKRLERYGTVNDLKIDSRRQSASIQLLAKGEVEPILLTVEKYLVTQDSSGSFVTIQNARASREWLTLLLEDVVLGKSFPIPEEYASYVKLVL